MLSFRHKPPKNAYLFQMVWKKITISKTDKFDIENRLWKTIETLKIFVDRRNLTCQMELLSQLLVPFGAILDD